MVDKKLAKYYWVFGVAAVTIIVMLLALFYIIVPSFKSIGNVNKELKANKEELKAAEQKLAKLKELKVKEDELKVQSQVVYRAIPTKKEVGDIFIQLKGLVEEAGGDGKKASGGQGSASTGTASTPAVAVAGVSSLTYTVDTTLPSYPNFKSLLASSEKALRFVHLDNIKIDSTDAFKVTLTYKAYYREQGSTQTEGEK